ncbi:MAG: hypothetical protein CTY15_12705 [Methylocystis sp.]|nr:MAG: hypothetical protein CTY15_12705 [Methylocystis sp.]
MSDFDQDQFPDTFKPRSASGSVVWSVAALSSAVFLCSVLGAKLLSHMVDRVGGLPAVTFNRSMQDVAKTAPTPSAPQVYSIVRSVGVDGMTTATIPHRGSAPLSPCGDGKK